MNNNTILPRPELARTSAIFYSLLLLIRALVVAGFLLPATFATASLIVTPSLTVKNDTEKNIIIAVHYMDSGNKWRTTSFITIPARQEKDLPVHSKNSIYYYYAESTSGKPTRWSGEHNRTVDGKPYPMKQTTLTLNKKKNRYFMRLFLNP